jgi:Na+-driven multidrug efflux pump
MTGLCSGWFLIQQSGLQGAAISFSIALLGNFVYHLFIFGKKEKVRWSDFVLRKSDFENLR